MQLKDQKRSPTIIVLKNCRDGALCPRDSGAAVAGVTAGATSPHHSTVLEASLLVAYRHLEARLPSYE